VGDEDAGVAAVVDPHLEIEEYLDAARFFGVEIAHILETHTHADRVSGHGRLAAATGATIHIHRAAEAEYPHEPFDDGWTLGLGRVRVRAVHTPGHRPEHTAFVLVDTARGEEPWAVLTGDSLFVSDIARPDLAVEAEDGARDLFRSLRERLLTLPAETEVWPGHLGGSLCGGPGMDLKSSSTIGYERAHNPLLEIGDVERFVALTTTGLPEQPANLHRIVEINRGPLLADAPDVGPLEPERVAALGGDGALVVDTRAADAFAQAHIPGAVSVPMARGGFGNRLGWLSRPGETVVLVGGADGEGVRAGRLAASVGIETVAGFLAVGMAAWRAEGRQVEALERLSIEDLGRFLEDDPDAQVLDVRERSAWEADHIPGSLQSTYHGVREGVPGLDPARPVAVTCSSGQRAGIAASLLARAGAARPVHVFGGGVARWIELGGPVEHGVATRA
jgi:glyoxylase-like metal-dependent hydrolase (beta-lactamase superfamily II)/rhodanese-related sulfurtransferase